MHFTEILYRSDFFPGLGWMLSKSIWDELSPKWPKAYPFLLNHFLIIGLNVDLSFFIYFKEFSFDISHLLG